MQRFTLVIPTYNDQEATLFTVHSNLIMHGEYIEEVIVVDGNHNTPASGVLVKSLASIPGVKYVKYNGVYGTAPTKDFAVKQANRGAQVVCIDSHVIIMPGGLKALSEYLTKYPNKKNDLIQGPLVYDDHKSLSTHFSSVWSGEMWGQWQTDPRVNTLESFAIPAQGMGLFCVNRDTWLGFPDGYRGFGAEEHIIHELYRQAGFNTICLSALKWWHRFARFVMNPYPLNRFEKVRNYCIGLKRCGIPLDDCRKHFVNEIGMSADDFDAAARGDDSPAMALVGEVVEPAPGCNTCNQSLISHNSLYDWYKAGYETKSDINEHSPTFAELAGSVSSVIDYGMRFGVHTVAMVYGAKEGTKVTYVGKEKPAYYDSLALFANSKGVALQFATGDSLKADVGRADLIFLDSEPHEGNHVYQELLRAADLSNRYIVVHDTNAPFGETGQGPEGTPGVNAGIRRFIDESRGKWFVCRYYANNHGLTVLSCDERDESPHLPPLWKMGVNFVKSEARDIANGRKRVSLEIQQQRYAVCTSNGGRCPAGARDIAEDRCTVCGCWLVDRPGHTPDEKTGKTWRPLDTCPLLYWGEDEGEPNAI